MSSPSLKSRRISVYFDLIRFIAAFAVMAGHWRNYFFVEYGYLLEKNIFINGFYFLTGFGHQAVIIFFVMSGFFIGSHVLKLIENNEWSWLNYLLSRLTRLYIVLIPALILGFLWDIFGVSLFGLSGLYGGNSINGIINYRIIDRLSFPTLLGNLFFLQEVYVSPFGSNGALWSLSYEFWFYIIFPLNLLVFRKKSSEKLVGKCLYIILSLTLLIFVGSKIRLYYLIWLLGAFLASHAPKNDQKGSLLGSVIFRGFSLSCLLLYLALIRTNILSIRSEFLSDLILGCLFSIFVYSMLHDFKETGKPKVVLPTYLAGFSYTLYLVHMPILVFLKEFLFPELRLQPNVSSFIISLSVLVVVIIYTFLIGSFTEAKTTAMRRFLLSKMENVSRYLDSLRIRMFNVR